MLGRGIPPLIAVYCNRSFSCLTTVRIPFDTELFLPLLFRHHQHWARSQRFDGTYENTLLLACPLSVASCSHDLLSTFASVFALCHPMYCYGRYCAVVRCVLRAGSEPTCHDKQGALVDCRGFVCDSRSPSTRCRPPEKPTNQLVSFRVV